MKECVLVDGMRSANGRAHATKGWFRNRMPDELLTAFMMRYLPEIRR
jgi:hypothetical protein